jgi:serine/threonine protein kinase
MLTCKGPKVMDLGVVSIPLSAEHTTTTAFLGSIRYAHPKYLFGERAGPSADLYSFGAIAYELLTGKRFCGDENNWAKLIVKKQQDSEKGMQSRDPEVLDEDPMTIADYKDISQRSSVNAAEAARCVLQSSLSSWRDLSASSVQWIGKAVAQQFWQAPFYCKHGQVIPGEPNIAGPGDWKGEKPLVSVAEAAAEIKRSLTSSELEQLKRRLGDWYWAKFFENSSHNWPPFDTSGLAECFHLDLGECWWHFHDSVRASYRYGYFGETQK